MAAVNLTAQRLRELLSYDPETGELRWLVRTSARVSVGDPAGAPGAAGYLRFHVDGRHYYAHRLAWLHATGEWPAHQIDHINGVRTDNRLANLRDASLSINAQNQRVARPNSASGLLGAFKNGNRWASYIKTAKRRIFLGNFATPEEAHDAYVNAKRKLHDGCTI